MAAHQFIEDAFQEEHFPFVKYPEGHRDFEEGDRKFETYGEDAKIIAATDPSLIWTEIDTDTGISLVSGFQFVNRIHHYISTVPVPQGESYEIVIIDDTENDDNEVEE